MIFSVQTNPKGVEYYMRKCIKLSGRIYERKSEMISEKSATCIDQQGLSQQRINRGAVTGECELPTN